MRKKAIPVLVLFAVLLSIGVAGPAWAQTAVINEFVANHVDADDYEYLEIYGAPNTDYSGLTLLEIEGDSTSAVGTIDGAWTAGLTDGNGIWWVGWIVNDIENGTVTLLLVDGFTGTTGTDLDTDNDGVFDVTPWTTIVDSVAVNDGGAADVTYSTVVLGVSYDGLPFAPGGASRIPDGYDTDSIWDWRRNDFDGAGIPALDPGTPAVGEALNTPGLPNDPATAVTLAFLGASSGGLPAVALCLAMVLTGGGYLALRRRK